MPNQVESTGVLDGAVRVLAQALWWAEHDYGQGLGADWADVGGERRERLYDRARFALREAYPFIRNQEHQRVRETLEKSREPTKAALRVLDPDWPSFLSPMSRADQEQLSNAQRAVLAAFQAALDSLEADDD